MSDGMLPYSAACDRNKEPLLERLRFLLPQSGRVFEVGSGTAQHAAHFASALPALQWTCSDLAANHPGIRARIEHSGLGNLRGPIELDVRGDWPAQPFDAVFSANTVHIMPFDAVPSLFKGVRSLLEPGGRFILYGPFHHGGRPTSSGNAAFDHELKARGNGEGIRDVEAVHAIAADCGLRSLADLAMPANNRLLAWEKCHAE